MSKKWFEVDPNGLRRIVGDRAAEVIANELISNALDATGVTRVDMCEDAQGNLVVDDDGTLPWVDLDHAFTLFARSSRAAQADLRGRFNLGEKLVLAYCSWARISTMGGSVIFSDGGRRRSSAGEERGTRIELRLRRGVRVQDIISAAMRILPPAGIDLRVNGAIVSSSNPLAVTEVSLPTIIEDEEGALRPATRQTKVEVLHQVNGSGAWLYELGVPVCALPDDDFSVNVHQKVPLPPSRDSVTPAYLRRIRTLVLDSIAHDIDEVQASKSWVSDALSAAKPETVQRVITARHGEKVVIFDPSEPEANKIATSKGYTVLSGGNFDKQTWQTIRDNQLALPAGRVTPAPKTGFSVDGRSPKRCRQITDGMRRFAQLVDEIGAHTIGRRPGVDFYSEPSLPHSACFGRGLSMGVNVGRLGYAWFDGPLVDQIDLIIHELGHEWSTDHLSREYYDALTKIGARLAMAVAAGVITLSEEAVA